MKSAIVKCNHIKEIDFECSQCGNCCREEGCIFLSEDDIVQMAQFFNLSKIEFEKKYAKPDGLNKILQGSSTAPCIFLENNKCSIYNARPQQCRSFPFWREIIKDRKSWKEKTKFCKGAKNTKSKIKKGKFTLLCIENIPYIFFYKD